MRPKIHKGSGEFECGPFDELRDRGNRRNFGFRNVDFGRPQLNLASYLPAGLSLDLPGWQSQESFGFRVRNPTSAIGK